MNKFFTKIVGASLGFAMAIGVSAVVGNSREAREVNADSGSALTISSYASTNSWTNGTAYATVNYDAYITLTGKTNGNNSKYYSSNNSWRHYEGDSGTITITAASGVTLNSATFAYANGNNGCLTYGDSNYTTGSEIDLSTLTTATIGVGHSSGSKNGNVQITSINISYTVSSSVPTISTVSATMNSETYYTGSTLSTSDFNVTVTWTEGKADTNPTSDFTWTVNGIANGALKEGDNEVIITYSGVSSDPFNVVGTTIHASAVEINKESIVLETIGETETLSATITPSNAVETVSWSSSDDSVATIDENGLVTGVSAGTATITATAGSVTDTCEVTVNNNSKVAIDFTQKDFSAEKPDSAQDEPTNATVNGYVLNFLNSYNVKNETTTYEYVMLATSDLATENTLISNKTPVPGAITKVLFETSSTASTSAKYNASLSASEIVSPVTDDTNSLVGKGSLAVTADASSNMHFFAISCSSTTKNGQIKSITVFYVPSTVKEDIGALDTQTSLAYRYNKDNEGKFSYSDISIRFGGYVSKDLWNELDALYSVTGFGVMITDGENIKDYEEFTEYVENSVFASSEDSTDVVKDIVDYFVPVSKMATTIAEDGNNYFWNLRWSVDVTEMDRVFSAVAYIKIGEEYVLLKKARMSVTYLAIDYMSNRGCTAETADGSLKNIVEQSSME